MMLVIRTFREPGGLEWKVWEVRPSPVRRFATGTKTTLTSESPSGWLAFESVRERRRLTPVPSDWNTLTDAELGWLCSRAVVAGKSRTLPR